MRTLLILLLSVNQVFAASNPSSVSVSSSASSPVACKLVNIAGSFYDAGGGGSGLTDTQLRATPVPVSGTSSLAGLATSVMTQVSASATSVSVLSANASRKYMVLVNDSTSVCYVAFSATASASAYTLRLAANGSYTSDAPYTGAVSAIWVSANGGLKVTEVSP